MNIKSKKKAIIFLIGVIFVFYNIYIFRSTANIVFSDQLRLLNIVPKYYEGHLSWSDLWAGYLEHRTPGYQVVILLNVIFFHYNTILEAHIGSIIMLCTLLVILKSFRESVKKLSVSHSGDEKKYYIMYLLIAMIMYSLNQWEIINFSVGFYIFFKSLLFIVGFYLFNDNLINSNLINTNKSLVKNILLCLVIVSSILLFAGGYSPAFIGSLILIGIYNALIKWKERRKSLIYILIITVISVISYCIYINGLKGSDLLGNLVYVLTHPVEGLKFISLSLSASIVGTEFASKYLNQPVVYFIGFSLMLIYIGSIYIYHKFKIYKYTFVPLLLICYSLLSSCLFVIGRLQGYGVKTGFSSRYTTETQLGIIGIFWVLFFFLSLIGYKRVFKIVVQSVILVMVGLFVFSNIAEWRTGPYRKIYQNDMRTMALNYSNYSNDELSKFQAPIEVLQEGLDIIKKYNLNVYYDTSKDYLSTGYSFGNGFYQKENGYRWISDVASGRFKSGHDGKMVFSGEVPKLLGEVEVSIFQGYDLKMKKKITGAFDLNIDVDKNSDLDITIKVDKFFVPKTEGMSGDERKLSLIIKNLQFN